MAGAKRRVAPLVVVVTLVASMLAVLASSVDPVGAAGVAFAKGHVMAAIGGGSVKHFDASGNLLDTLSGASSSYTAGMAFDSSGNLYTTGFDGEAVSKYDTHGNFLGTFGSGYNSSPESTAFDAAGNAYVGQANGAGDVLKFDAAGNPLASFDVATEDRGSDWVDLAADQCTLFYTSEGTLVKRFNVCTNTQLADFATLPGGAAYALRIRPNGEVLVAATSALYRLDSAGNLLQTYTIPNASLLFAMNLDPNGTSFWTGDLGNGDINRVDIATGNILTTFNASPSTALGGLAVVGEIRAATPPPPPHRGPMCSTNQRGVRVRVLVKPRSTTVRTVRDAVMHVTAINKAPGSWIVHLKSNGNPASNTIPAHNATVVVHTSAGDQTLTVKIPAFACK